jgi:hypothetical protein
VLGNEARKAERVLDHYQHPPYRSEWLLRCLRATLEPRQCRVLPCPARSRSKGVPTAPISAPMPRLPRQKQTLSKDLYPSPPEPLGTSRASRRPLEGILARLTRRVGYLSVTCSCAVFGALGLPEFSPVSRASHSYSPSPSPRVVPPDR